MAKQRNKKDCILCRWYVADGPLARKASLEGMSKDKNAIMSKKEMTSLPASETERVILLRGVVWQGKEVNAFKMWQDLMRFWPAPFAPEHTKKPDLLYAHAGKQDHRLENLQRLMLGQAIIPTCCKFAIQMHLQT